MLLLHDPIAFPKGARARRKNPKRRNLPLRTHFPFQAGREGAARAVRPTGRACALHGRPLEGNRVAGLTAPPGVRLRGRRVPPPLLPLPLSPRRGSGSGGTMFTSTGSSGLCEYRPPPSWLYPTRHAAHLLKEAGGGGGLRVAGRLGADPPSRRPHLGAACPWGAAGTAPTSACGGEWGLSPAASPAPSAYQPQVRCSGALGTVAGGQLASGWGRWCPGPAPALRGACARPRGAAVLLEARLEAGLFLVTLLHSFRLTRDQWARPHV